MKAFMLITGGGLILTGLTVMFTLSSLLGAILLVTGLVISCIYILIQLAT